MDSAKAVIVISLSIDLILFFIIASSMFSELFTAENYSVSLRSLGFVYNFEETSVPASISLRDFQEIICGPTSEISDPLCPSVKTLKILGELYSFFTLLTLVSILLSCLHFILVITIRSSTYKVLSHFHYLTGPLYLLISFVYFISFRSLFEKPLIGFYLTIIANLIAVFQSIFYVYIKKVKNWGLQMLKYDVIDDNKLEDDSRESEIEKSEDSVRSFEEIQKKYNQLKEEYEEKGRRLEIEQQEYFDEMKVKEEKREEEIRKVVVKEFEGKIEKAVKETKEKVRVDLENGLEKAYETRMQNEKYGIVKEYEDKIKELGERSFRDGYMDSEKKYSQEISLKVSQAEQEFYNKGLLEGKKISETHSKTIEDSHKKLALQAKEFEEKINLIKNSYEEKNVHFVNEKDSEIAKHRETLKLKENLEIQIKDLNKKISVFESSLESNSQVKNALELAKESENKLKVEINLLRNIEKSMTEASEKTKIEMRVLQEEKEKLEKSLSGKQIEAENFAKKILDLQNECESSSKKVQFFENEISLLKQSTDAKITSLESEINSISSENTRLKNLVQISEESSSKLLTENVSEHEEKIKALKSESAASDEALKSKISILDKEKQDLQGNLTSLLMENHNLTQKVDEFESELSSAKEKLLTLEKANAEILSKTTENAELAKSLSAKNAEIEQLAGKIKQQEAEKADLQKNLTEMVMENSKLNTKLEELENP